MVKGVSVIICCYNSAKNLPRTIEALACQEGVSNILWEVLIVDNNSKDNTSQVAREEWARYDKNTPMRIVTELSPGLSAARAQGFKSATYEFCLFCDDDNWLSRNYIASAYEILVADPAIGVLGGVGEEITEIPPPAWFKEERGAFAVGQQGYSSGDVSKRGYVYGAGAIFRKSVFVELVQIGFTSFLTDRKGNTLTSGGDKELCYAYLIRGFKIWYSDRLKFKHFIPAYKLHRDYLNRMLLGFSSAQPVLTLYEYVINNAHPKISSLGLRLLWPKDLIYTLYLTIGDLPHGSFKLRARLEVLKSLFLLLGSYRSVYSKIGSLREPTSRPKI